MVISRQEFNETHGNVYLIPYDDGDFIVAQIGVGGDIGIFEGLYGRDVDLERMDPRVLFRVHYGQVSPNKFNWIAAGMFPYKDEPSRPQPYLHRAIGSNECVLVTYGQEDYTVSCEDGAAYETLATWSHEHILDRFRRTSKR